MPSVPFALFARSIILIVTTLVLVGCTVGIPAAPSPAPPTAERLDLTDWLLAPEQLPLGWLRQTYIFYENSTTSPPGNGTSRPVQQQGVTLTAIPAPARGENKDATRSSIEVRQMIWVYPSEEAAARAFTAEQEIWAQFTHEPRLETITSQLSNYLFRYNTSPSSGAIKCQYVALYGKTITKVDIWLEGQGGAYEWKTLIWAAENRLIAAGLPAE